MSAGTGTTSSSSVAARPGARSPTGSPPTAAPACWCSRPAAPTSGSTRSSTCRRRCRSRSATGFYDWKYETEPEPHMDGRRVYHARGKVLGGSSQHQRDDLPARQPDGLRALGRRAGHEEVGLPPLPAVLQADGDLPRPAPTTGAAATARSSSSAARPTNPLFGAFFEAVQQAGYPLTDDVNGYRQEGFARFDRNVHRGRRLSAARAYLHPVRHRKNLNVETLALATRVRFEGKRAVGVDYLRGGRLRRTRRRRRGDPLRRRDQHPAAAPALRRRRRGAARAARHRRRPRPRRASARTSRTTSRSTSSTPPSSRSRSRPACSGASARASATSGCSTAAGSAPPTTSRAAASPAATRTSTTPT